MRTLYLLLLVACGASAVQWPFQQPMNEHEQNHNELNEHDQHDCLRMPTLNGRVNLQICCTSAQLYGTFYKCAAEHIQRSTLRQLERDQRRNRRRWWKSRNITATTTTTPQPVEETDEEPPRRFNCYLENSTMFDKHFNLQPKEVLEVAMCSFSANSSYAASVPHIVDECVAAYGVALRTMADNLLHPEYGCLSRSMLLIECLNDQRFVRCPADKWNLGMESGCEDLRTFKYNCPSHRMQQIYRDLNSALLRFQK